MRTRKTSFLFLLLLLPSAGLASLLQVHFIDVGQGDSIFIETPLGKKILIDAGSHFRSNDPRNPFYHLRESFKPDKTLYVVISANFKAGASEETIQTPLSGDNGNPSGI